MLKAENVCYSLKSRRNNFLINNLSISLDSGFIMAVVGKNGSGKSTILKILYGLIKPDKGIVAWNDKNVLCDKEKIRLDIAYVGDESGMFDQLTVNENIELLSTFYPEFSKDSWDNLVEQFSIKKELLMHKLCDLSRGEKKRVCLAFAIAKHPKLLILDEPTAGLDPVFRVDFMEILQKLVADEEISVVISTHILSDVKYIADYILKVDAGKTKMAEAGE